MAAMEAQAAVHNITCVSAAKTGDEKMWKTVTENRAEPEVSRLSASFREDDDDNVAAHYEKPALDELRELVRSALFNHDFLHAEDKKDGQAVLRSNDSGEKATEAEAKDESESGDEVKNPEAIAAPSSEAASSSPAPAEDDNLCESTSSIHLTSPRPPQSVSIWGVPLLTSAGSDTVLLKFLRARDLNPEAALAMLRSTVLWRESFKIDSLLRDNCGRLTNIGSAGLDRVVFTRGRDRRGHPVCYNVYGEFVDEDLYKTAFSQAEGSGGRMFLRWRVRALEKAIREELDFGPGGISTMVQVTDLRNSPGPGKKELRAATREALLLLQDNYPEFVAKQIFINVPWWYRAVISMINPFLTPRARSKFVFAGPSNSTEALFKYIAPEQVPVQYGGLNTDDEPSAEFTVSDPAMEVFIKPYLNEIIEIPLFERRTAVWEVRVRGWDVNYSAEFVPDCQGSYSVVIEKPRKLPATASEAVLRNSFKLSEPGRVLITVGNNSFKKKRLVYRWRLKDDGANAKSSLLDKLLEDSRQ